MSALYSLCGACSERYSLRRLEAQYAPRVERITLDDVYGIAEYEAAHGIDYTKCAFRLWVAEVKGSEYLIFGFLHAFADGIGAAGLVKAFFELLSNPDSRVAFRLSPTDLPFLKAKAFYRGRLGMKGNIQAGAFEPVNRSLRVSLPYESDMLTCRLVCAAAKLYPGGTVSFMIPVNIRGEGERDIVSNLTLPIFLDVSAEDTPEDVKTRLKAQLSAHRELNLANAESEHYDRIPPALRLAYLKRRIRRRMENGRLLCGGIISNVGAFALPADSGVNKAFLAAVSQPGIGIGIISTVFERRTEISLSYYKGQYTDKAIAGLVGELSSLPRKKDKQPPA